MGGHGDHGHEYKIPSADIYKAENVPQLVKLQKRLAEHGLKDPWIRNEVWRYEVFRKQSFPVRFLHAFFRGLRFGIPLAALTIYMEKQLGIDYYHWEGRPHYRSTDKNPDVHPLEPSLHS